MFKAVEACGFDGINSAASTFNTEHTSSIYNTEGHN